MDQCIPQTCRLALEARRKVRHGRLSEWKRDIRRRRKPRENSLLSSWVGTFVWPRRYLVSAHPSVNGAGEMAMMTREDECMRRTGLLVGCNTFDGSLSVQRVHEQYG
jgi:hypothetical protein